jgi:hypothetical protein
LKDTAVRERKAHRRYQNGVLKTKTLSRYIPICVRCKKIRDDKGDWQHVETYVSRHSDTQFSHGLCPVCAKELYPDMQLEDEEER